MQLKIDFYCNNLINPIFDNYFIAYFSRPKTTYKYNFIL